MLTPPLPCCPEFVNCNCNNQPLCRAHILIFSLSRVQGEGPPAVKSWSMLFFLYVNIDIKERTAFSGGSGSNARDG